MVQPDPALVGRFTADLAALAESDGRFLLAVSGGPDSLAMLLLAHAACPDRIACATVDHGLRAEAAGEAAMVARLCGDLALPHAILTLALESGGNIQARARQGRYDALAAHAKTAECVAILTAHHADDQAETLLMRASRGSGVDGLAGARARGRWGDMPVLRPLLEWRRADLLPIIDAAGVAAVDDPANHDPAHDRTRFRALLADTPDFDPLGMARSAAALADASDALSWSTALLAQSRVQLVDGGATVDSRELPREYRRRLLVATLDALGVLRPRGPAVNRLLLMLERGEAGTIGDIKASPTNGIWRLEPAPPRRSH